MAGKVIVIEGFPGNFYCSTVRLKVFWYNGVCIFKAFVDL